MTITLRQNKGSPLTIAELDGNFTDLDGRLEVVEAGQTSVKSIDEIVQVGNSLVVQYNDTSTDGPFTFEVLINYRGDWAASTTYAVNDLVRANGVIYLVVTAHTSDTTFDAGANNGSASDYYVPFLSMPELSIPVGGGTGYVLRKASDDDFDTEWAPSGVPAGGTTGAYLRKSSGADYDADWVSVASAATIEVTSATLTLTSTYIGAYVRCTTGCIVTVPTDDQFTGVENDDEIHFRQVGTDAVIFMEGSDSSGGVTINPARAGYNTDTPWRGSTVTLKKVGANEWDLIGPPGTTGSF